MLALMERERVGPHPGAIGVEHQRRIFRRRDPRSARDLVVELVRRPAGIAERDQALLRTLAASDIAQHLGGIGQRHAAIDIDCVRPAIIGAMQRKGDTRAHRAAEENRHIVGDGLGDACGIGAKAGEGCGKNIARGRSWASKDSSDTNDFRGNNAAQNTIGFRVVRELEK